MNNIQAVLESFYPHYKEVYNPSAQQAKAVNAIMNCKTEAMGGHVFACDECGQLTVTYNSCRNRHCPSCQGINRAVWVDARNKDVLNAPYFHVVFTMPQELHLPIYQNQKLLYNLMYKVAAETLAELCWDEKYLGAQIGFFSILHTWGQDLHFHPHIHTVVMAGGLTKTNQWRKSSKKFFIPVKVLAKKFRGKFLYHLKKLYYEKQINFYGSIKQYHNQWNFQKLLDKCYGKDWYTYTKRTFSGPRAVIQYLGRYTHRIAISNQRIAAVDENTVTITVSDYKDKGKSKLLTLKGVEFVRRFLMHILPKGFVKIRYYGLLASRNKKTKLELCRRLTHSPRYQPSFEGLNTLEILCMILKRNVRLCPVCKRGNLCLTHKFYPGASP